MKINNINNINFSAQYKIIGKDEIGEITKEYDKKILEIAKNGHLAVEAQEFMQSSQTKAKLNQLPDDVFVRLHTTPIDNGIDASVGEFTPYLDVYQNDESDIYFMKDEMFYGANTFELRQNKEGLLDENSILKWFDKIIGFYNKYQK